MAHQAVSQAHARIAQGLRFVRYPDDCNFYVCSRRAGERTMQSISRLQEMRLKLKVNTAKSAEDRPARRKFLGWSFTAGASRNGG